MALAADWFGSVFTNVLASLVLLAGGFLIGRYRERKRQQGRALTECDFYPYVATPERFAEFSLKDFRLGVHYFLRNNGAGREHPRQGGVQARAGRQAPLPRFRHAGRVIHERVTVRIIASVATYTPAPPHRCCRWV